MNKGHRGPYRCHQIGKPQSDTLAAAICYERRAAGLTQAALGDKVHLSRSQIAQIERNHRPILAQAWNHLTVALPNLAKIEVNLRWESWRRERVVIPRRT